MKQEKYDYIVGIKGEKLSGGQKQYSCNSKSNIM